MHTAAANLDSTACTEVLATVLAAGPGAEPNAVKVLDSLNAFERLGIRRSDVLRVAQERHRAFRREEGGAIPMLDPVVQMDRAGLLERIEDEDQQLLLCRLAAAVLTADGRIQADERRLYERMLSAWRLTQADVSAAIRRDPAI